MAQAIEFPYVAAFIWACTNMPPPQVADLANPQTTLSRYDFFLKGPNVDSGVSNNVVDALKLAATNDPNFAAQLVGAQTAFQTFLQAATGGWSGTQHDLMPPQVTQIAGL
jgi:hypothetical protein